MNDDKKYCSFCKREIPKGEPYRNAFIKLSKENIKMCKDCEDRTIKETIRNYGVRLKKYYNDGLANY